MAREVNFTRVLIANRGEIARRIRRACAKLGLESIAVYSEADRGAPYVAEADRAVCIGPPAASLSYLNIDAILDAARAAGADAVHPGYGFLSENAEFARRVIEAGLVFVGPSPEAIARMGSKIEAKAMAAAADIPVLPGYRGHDQSAARLLREAESLGVPFLVKASAGGGGRGMRAVADLAHAADAIAAAHSEAKAAFGDGTVFLERLVPRARHVEVQVLGDVHGNAVHLWERDCSLQRNHQKLIEEAPAPDLPERVRGRMLEAAVRLARTIGYTSAGTVEYLYDAGREEFYFLEMNTRLQVEHPVTEAVTGIDLVEWQLRIARGERLGFAQEDIGCAGHAVEIRIAAEDPAESFRPQTGRVTLWEPPSGPGLRLDSGVEGGSEVSHHYDSMLAKLTVHGSGRGEAIRRAVAALDRFAAGGVTVNLAYQRALLTHPEFAAVRHHTSGLGEMFPGGWRTPEPDSETSLLAALALHLHLCGTASEGAATPWHRLGAWRVTAPAGRPGGASYWLAGEEPREIEVRGQGPAFEVHGRAGGELSATAARFSAGCLSVMTGASALNRTAYVERAASGWRVHLQSPAGMMRLTLFTLEDLYLQQGAMGDGERDGDTLRAPMPGTVTNIGAMRGERVKRGQVLMEIEAMKLLHKLSAPAGGTVEEIYCKAGDTVTAGAPLIRIDREDNE